MCSATLPAARSWLLLGLTLAPVPAAHAADCAAPCVEQVAVNAHAGSDHMLVVVGARGADPALFAYDKVTGAAARLGPLFEAGSSYASAPGARWYFSARRPATLYLTDAGGSRLERYDVLTKALETVFDAGLAVGAGRRVSGAHSSDDDATHSAIVSDRASGATVGCLVHREEAGDTALYPARGPLAQCRIDGTGRRLLIRHLKDAGEADWMVDLATGEETPLPAEAATDDASPDPTRLPVATTGQAPLLAAYNLLQVPARAAGSVYLDPTTGVKVYKLTSATFPATSARWGHDYAEGGDEVSLPYNGTTRAVLVRQNGGSWWLVDFTPGVGVGNPRPLAGPLAPLMDLAFTFSNNPATPYYAYVSGGATIRRIDIRTMAEAPGNGWPVTGESSAMWLHQSENDGLFVWMRGANGSTVVGYEPATGTRKTFTDPNLNEPRIDRAGRYIGLSMNTPLNGLVVWDWQANAVLWRSPGDPGIPFAHNASLRRRWMTVDWNMSYPPDFSMFRSDVPNSAAHVGGPANGTTVHGNGNWVQHPANLDDQWALFCHYGSLRPAESYWLAPGAMVLVTPSGQRRILGHPYNTTGDYTFFTFAKFSSDGRYVLFTSDMNGSGRSDVFLAEVPLAPSSPDTTPPTVALTAPAAGAIVSGSAVAVSASAADDVGVVGVQFRLDGSPLGGEDTAPPFGVSWNTTLNANGSHALTAVARDAAGHATVSAPVVVTVDNPAAPPIGLVAYLKLDDGKGTTAADSSGVGRAGRLFGGATWGAGHRGRAVVLDGADDFIRVPHAAALNAFPLSAAVWFKTSSGSGVRGLVNKYVGGSYNGYQIFFNDGKLCAWYLRDTSNFVYDGGGCTLATAGYNDGAWHQAVLVVDAAGGRLYVDGALKGSRAWTGAAGPPTTTRTLGIGVYPGGPGGDGYLPGAVDEVQVYGRALGAGEVLQLFNARP